MLGQLKMIRRVYDVVAEGGQFLIASHSPILLAFPAAKIYEFTAEGLTQVGHEDTALYQLPRSFLEAPERFLRHPFSDDESSGDQGPAESGVS